MTIEYLCFSGGGSKGIAFCGTMIVLEDYRRHGMLCNIKGCIGTSIGALFALATVLEANSTEVFEMLFEEHILEECVPQTNISNMCNFYGLDTGLGLKRLVCRVLQLRIPTGDCETITLKQLHDLTTKELAVTCTDITEGKVVYFSHKSHPNMPVMKAIVASMSVPLLFEPLEHENHMYVDGGMLDNVSLAYFPRNKSLAFKLGGPLTPCSAADIKEAGISSFVKRLIDCSLHWNEVLIAGHKAEDSKNRDPLTPNCIQVFSGQLSTLTFRPSRTLQLQAILHGICSTHSGLWNLKDSGALENQIGLR